MVCTDGLIETGGHDLDTGWRAASARSCEQPATATGTERPGGAGRRAGPGRARAVLAPHDRARWPTGARTTSRCCCCAATRRARRGAPRRHAAPYAAPSLTVAQAEPERIAGARQQLRELLHDWADEDQIDAAVLMVSEMVTNVLVHTDGDALLVAEMHAASAGARRLRVEVADASDELPHRRQPGELASSGRGLMLMEMLADAWGVDPRGEGK